MYGESYVFAQFVLFKGLALSFLIAFIVALKQYIGLCGENGILPVKDFVETESFWKATSIFYFFNSDRTLKYSAITGIVISLFVIFGVPSIISPTISFLSWMIMWLIFLSFVNTGQEFYNDGWDTILLEAGFLAAFLGGLSTKPSETVVWLFRWLLFRMMLGSGLIKIHGDKAWKDLTALDFHFETQPFPNPLSRFFHFLPPKIHKIGVLGSHFVLLLVPFLYFLPQPFAAIGGVFTLLYQLNIFLTGNYTWLNTVTSVLAFSTISDKLMLFEFPISNLSPYPYSNLPVILAGLIIVMSYPVVKNMISADQVQNITFDPFHLVNSYGAFGEVDRKREVPVIQGLVDGEWKDFIYYELPIKTCERPRQISPYIHRLDYTVWEQDDKVMDNLRDKLEENSETVKDLFKEIPEGYSDVRIKNYIYRFNRPEEKDYWERKSLN